MRCRDIMKKNVKCCSPSDAAYVAAEKMRDENVGFIPICDGSRHVLGTLTDRDLAIRLIADRLPLDTQCSELMTKNVITCGPGDVLAVALQKMSKHQVARILCVDGQGALVGVISLSDLAQQEPDQRVARTMRDVTDREVTVH